MPTDACLTNVARRDWLTDGPFNHVVPAYIEALRNQRYADHTIRSYLGCLAHFSYWIKAEGIELPSLDSSLIKRFLRSHLPACTCPPPCNRTVANTGAALRHLLRLLPRERATSVAADPVTMEVDLFGDYLTNTCGLAPATRHGRVQHIRTFLGWRFGTQTPMVSQLSAAQLDAFCAEMSTHMRPASLRAVCNSLRSYFRYRALRGESTAALAAALPRIADWRRTTLPKVLSDSELEAFMKAFDCADPVGLRDYAIARCLLDLGLRGHEVTYLTLESVDWRSATLTISSTKSKRVVSRRKVKGKKEGREVRYYISSRRGSGKMFLGASRRHWGIENECHWVLDVAFREDDHRLREGHAPANMSVVRKMALAMLKKATAKIGIKNKRLKAGWDETFLEHVLCDFLDK